MTSTSSGIRPTIAILRAVKASSGKHTALALLLVVIPGIVAAGGLWPVSIATDQLGNNTPATEFRLALRDAAWSGIVTLLGVFAGVITARAHRRSVGIPDSRPSTIATLRIAAPLAAIAMVLSNGGTIASYLLPGEWSFMPSISYGSMIYAAVFVVLAFKSVRWQAAVGYLAAGSARPLHDSDMILRGRTLAVVGRSILLAMVCSLAALPFLLVPSSILYSSYLVDSFAAVVFGVFSAVLQLDLADQKVFPKTRMR